MPLAATRDGQQTDRAAQFAPVAVAVAVEVLVDVSVAVAVDVPVVVPVLLSPAQVPVVQVAEDAFDPVGSQLESTVTGWPPVQATVIVESALSTVPVATICPELFLIVRS
jgi:hypothetical protein